MFAIRSIFITLYSSLVFLGSIYFAVKLSQGYDKTTFLTWMMALPMALFLATILIAKSIPRTSAMLWPVTIPTVIAALFIINGYHQQQIEVQQLIFPGISAIGYGLYIFWYSKMPLRDSSKLRLNEPFPKIELENMDGQKVSSEQLKEKSIWIFFRGNWCPLCMAQVREIANQYQQIDELGYRINLVSPQPLKFTQELATKFNVSFNFYSDKNNLAAVKLGLAIKNGLPFGMTMLGYDKDSVLPAVVICNEEGRVIWIHQTDNYRIRPEPGTFMQVIQQYQRGEKVTQPNEVSAIWNNVVIANSNETIVVEGNHYFPRKDVHMEYLNPSQTTSICPWKGQASYYDIEINGELNKDAAWYYPAPSALASKIIDYIAFWKGVDVK